jgi:integrator complex subunit 11
MPEIKVTPLGAGQDVGRSCILLNIGGKNVMLDCGMHMGYNDERRFPDFSYIVPEGPITSYIDCVIISHFHLDHCGELLAKMCEIFDKSTISFTFQALFHT